MTDENTDAGDEAGQPKMRKQNFGKFVGQIGFENIEDGSLFARFKVNNDDVWNGIKDGDFRGFSLEGLFVFELEEKNNDIDEIIELLNKILN